MRNAVLYPLLTGLMVLAACDHPRVTDTAVGSSWPADERLQTLRAHLHITESGAEARALFPDLIPVFVDQAIGKQHPARILPFTYYWSPSGHFTVSICNVGKTVFICPYYVSSRLSPMDFTKCDVEPVYLSFELAP
jgi:hypothetical protein